DESSEPERMCVGHTPGGIFLHAVRIALPIDARRHAVDEEIAELIRPEMQLVVAIEIGKLVIDTFGRVLVGEHVELGELLLPLIEKRRIETGDRGSRKTGGLPGIVRDLEQRV